MIFIDPWANYYLTPENTNQILMNWSKNFVSKLPLNLIGWIKFTKQWTGLDLNGFLADSQSIDDEKCYHTTVNLAIVLPKPTER